MSLIKVENLSFSYPSSYEKVFDNVSFEFDTNWKLGLVARNGKGKTTFLNLLLGKYEYNGRIISSTDFTYFPFVIDNKFQKTIDVLLEINNEVERWKIERELSYLDVKEDVLDQEFNTLSNGEQTKVLLAFLFLNESNYLLIDEPTNHLDSNGRKLVASYLKKKRGFLLVSHDRNFLDECVDHILSFERSKIEVKSGNFSSWFKTFNEEQLREELENERLKKDISRLEKASRQAAKWSNDLEKTKFGNGPVDRGYIGHKAAKMMKRSKNIETRRNSLIEDKSKLLKNVEVAEELKIHPLTYHQTTYIIFKELSIYYDDRLIFSPLSFEVNEGERVFLEGKNGSGKTSILNLIVNKNIAYKGEVYLPSGLIISYVPQDTSFLKGTLNDFIDENNLDETLFKTILRKMDFSRTQLEKDMKDFSMGQKKKVLIAKSLSSKAHLYIWDEPLNYIDVFSRIQIENLIKEYKPTMLLVEHDEAFKKSIATKVVRLDK